jgi:hypothetical protein
MRKFLVVTAGLSLLVFGVVAVYAQGGDDGDAGTDAPFSPPCLNEDGTWAGPAGFMGRRGMMMHGHGFAAGCPAATGEEDASSWGGHMMGGMMGGMGMMWGGSETHMMTGVAEVLGMELEALMTELHGGKTMAAIAEAQGVDLSVVTGAAMAAHVERMAEAVEAGWLTQEQADEMTAMMAANIGSHFTEGMPCVEGFDDAAYGPGMMGGMIGHMMDGSWADHMEGRPHGMHGRWG